VRCAAGVAANKMIAKLVSGVHKPDDQTYVPPGFRARASLVAPLAMRALPGVGRKIESELARRGVVTAADARRHARRTFVEWLGARVGASVHDAAWGVDRSEVMAKAPQQMVTCQDSFRACEGAAAARLALAALAPDLVRRMDEERDEHEPPRVAGRLVVRWRERWPSPASAAGKRGTDRAPKSGSVSAPMPATATDARLETEARAEAVAAAASRALAGALPKSFNLTLLAVGATAFRNEIGTSSEHHRNITRERALSSFFANVKGTEPLTNGLREEEKGEDPRGEERRFVPPTRCAPTRARALSKREARERVSTRDFFTSRESPPNLTANARVVSSTRARRDTPEDRSEDRSIVAERAGAACGRNRRRRDSNRGDDASCSDEEDDGAAFFADLADTVAEPKRRRGA